jgi:hypothetical protein
MQIIFLTQGYTNPWQQVTHVTRLCLVGAYVCGSLVWDLLYATILAPRMVGWFLDFWNFGGPLM